MRAEHPGPIKQKTTGTDPLPVPFSLLADTDSGQKEGAGAPGSQAGLGVQVRAARFSSPLHRVSSSISHVGVCLRRGKVTPQGSLVKVGRVREKEKLAGLCPWVGSLPRRFPVCARGSPSAGTGTAKTLPAACTGPARMLLPG